MKIIQISSASSSYSVRDYEKDFFLAWYAQVGFQIKKFYRELNVECWTVEKEYKEEKMLEEKSIKFRIFPTEISLRHSMEISLSLLKAIREEIKKAKEKNEKIIFHLHEYHSWITYSILFLLNKKENIKVLSQHHGGRSPIANLKKYKKLLLFFPIIWFMQLCENSLFKKVDTFYALSNEEINYLKNISPKSKISFQTMGIGEEYFESTNKNDAKKKFKMDKKKKYILYIGRITSAKGITELLNAMKQIQREDIELLLIGGGKEKDVQWYKRYADKKKINNARFIGQIYGKEKLDYLSAVDCLILPSYTEGAPVVLMEAMAKNLPVIATDVGGISIMIKDGQEGRIIRPKSSGDIVKAIKEILTWKNKKIKKTAEKYRWNEIIKKTLEDYNER